MATETLHDPRDRYARPPFPDQPQSHPGSSERMQPQPDYGENSYRGSGRLAGRKAIVTGADSGIGRAVALAFAREGADVLISYLSEDDDAAETVRLVESAGRKAVPVRGDICQERVCTDLVGRAVAELGGVDILVNNAAFQNEVGGIAEISSEQFDRTLKTNLYALFWLSKAALAVMPPGGSIINTASAKRRNPARRCSTTRRPKAGSSRSPRRSLRKPSSAEFA